MLDPSQSLQPDSAGSSFQRAALLTTFPCLFAVMLMVSGCAKTAQVKTRPKDKAAAAYVDGLKSMASSNFLEAQQTFTGVVKMPAYLAATTVARIRLADTLFAQSKYEEAVQVYQGYVRRHDGSSNVPYARFRIAQSYFQLVPTDFWLLPPVFEMDLSTVERARYYLEAFIRRYPTSDFGPQALTMRDRCIELQMAQHRYVIRFYQGRKKPMGVIFRSHELMRRFPVRGHGVADYTVLASAYGAVDWRRRELELQREIARRWPSQSAGKSARSRVAALGILIAKLKAEGKKDAEMPVELPPTAKDRPELLAGPDGAARSSRKKSVSKSDS
ncbi:MAG: outer membrane protein assembly factor BamD [Myxococcales bacterium]|nr:outer membrane protein assembly factor BamD [Myxococcales bacterium]